MTSPPEPRGPATPGLIGCAAQQGSQARRWTAHRPTARFTIGLLVVAALGAIATGCGPAVEQEDAVVAPSPSESSATCGPDDPPDEPPCGVPFEELRSTNLRYADRLDFEGDPSAALATAEEVRAALDQLVDAQPAPTVEDINGTLALWSDEVQVATNAVRTAGTGFGFGVDGGCVFGSVSDGQVDVSVGGYVNDGGCLASYGH
jgi:hypothetical protein